MDVFIKIFAMAIKYHILEHRHHSFRTNWSEFPESIWRRALWKNQKVSNKEEL